MSPQIYNTGTAPFKHISKRDTHLDEIASIVKAFLAQHSTEEYQRILPTNEPLETFLITEMKNRNVRYPRLEKTVHHAASLAELAFHKCSFDEKKMIALYIWFTVYIDDTVTADASASIVFQQRFMQGLPQLDPALDLFADLLHLICALYPPLQANLFLSATFEFVSVTCVEPQLTVENQPQEALKKAPATRLPLFLRERTGLGVPAAMLAFSPSQHTVEFLNCFRALADMNFWTAACNDLLSFYKEEIAGETATYIHIRATAEGRTPLDVLASLKDEMHGASQNIENEFGEDQVAVEIWRRFEYGYIAWHLDSARYKLQDIVPEFIRRN